MSKCESENEESVCYVRKDDEIRAVVWMCQYVPPPRSSSSLRSSQEMYDDISDLASIPNISQELLSFLMAQQILAFDGSSFAVHANVTETSIVFVSFAERLTVWLSEKSDEENNTIIWREHNLVWFFEPSGVKLDVQFFPAGVG